MKISVVTVCYNAVQTLEKTMLSVLNQTYPYVEYIIIDGGSTDGTVDIIKKYADRLAYWVSEPDKGIYDAMNKGIKAATGEWINFMNSGDTFYEANTLAQVCTFMEGQVADIVYGDAKYIYEWGDIIRKPFFLSELRKHMIFCHQSAFVKMNIMKKYKFSLKYKISGDYNFFYQQYMLSRRFSYLSICISNFDAVDGVSSRNCLVCLKEDARINGRKDTISWKFFYYKTWILVSIKSSLKSILPRKVVLILKKTI
ncbi:glycosyltransferase family 2 protein [Mediterranea sp. An20]|uniref:glycosyltransferase family 2 protein n=1 Tax=Mediterranea sp. An20 TaxID=1965586 RepID=UPI001EF70F61|nr:glycosyltransferase family 2 protein [Mediterranea sp. An20]